MSALIFVAIGLAIGALVAWLAASSRSAGIITELRSQVGSLQAALTAKEQQTGSLQQEVRKESEQRAIAQTELSQAQRALEEQKQLLDDAKKTLSDAFGALASEALQKNSGEFLKLAATRFQTLENSAKTDLDKRQQSIDQLVKPLKESLERYEKQLREMEIKREGAYAGIDTHLSDLQKLTGDLNTALRGSHTKVRGRWGELTLHRVAELAGMSEFCDFDEQESRDTEAGKQRPDMIVNLPGGRRFPVDSKVPLEAFLGAVSAATEDERVSQLSQHGRLVRAHMERLAKQGYPELFRPAPDIVVMFLPGESFLAAALEQDGRLLEDAMQKRVMLATPTVLISLLLAVHHGWQQQEVAKSAAEIRDLGKTLYERMGTATNYFSDLGAALEKAVESYNSAIGSLETRFFPAARKFKELAVPAGNDLAVLEPVEERPRLLTSPEWETEGDKRDTGRTATERSRAAGE